MLAEFNKPKIEKLVRQLLIELGDKPNRAGLVETPKLQNVLRKRVANYLKECATQTQKLRRCLTSVLKNPRAGKWWLLKIFLYLVFVNII